MKQERVILSFIMVLIGLLVAGALFYFYQINKQIPVKLHNAISPTPTPKIAKEIIFLNLTSPNNEIVVNNKTITVTGKTNPDATVIIITKADQQVFKTTQTGDFKAILTLETDQNLITIISVLPDGESKQIQRVVTYSTSNF
jgi:hypothetical protein